MSAIPHRHFLGWDRPLLATVVDFLTAGWRQGVLDLSDRLVVVPTRQSGRRLREALAERAAGKDAAVLPPRVLTPGAFLSACRPPDLKVASLVDGLVAWVAVLTRAALTDHPALFPQMPPRQDFAWALRVAEAWQAARQTLGEGGLDFRSAAARLGAAHPEAGRWADLAALEKDYLSLLAKAGLCDAQEARRLTAQGPVLPPELAQLVIAAVPDPLELAVHAWERVAAGGVSVSVLVAAPASMPAAFDEWGRPEAEVWQRRRDLPLALDRCHLCALPEDQAATVCRLAAGHAEPAATLALGIADPEVAQALRVNDEASFQVFLPEGRPMAEHELFHVLSGLGEVLREHSFAALGRWLRLPPVALALRQRAHLEETSQARLLEAWDEFATTHLPQTMADGRAFAEPTINKLVAAAEGLLEPLGTEPLSAAVSQLLAGIYGSRTFRQTDPAGAAFQAIARELAELMGQTEAALKAARLSPSAAEALAFVLGQLGRGQLDGERPADAVDLNGWLELPWEDAPHLIVAGFNDGLVPDAIVGDPYLPESLRQQLGLRRSNATRLARDAFLLRHLLGSREKTGGRVDVVLGKYSAAGDALRPSRLLFMCPDGDLASRAAALFGEDRLPKPRPLAPHRLAWRLRPPAPAERKALTALGVTAFRDYLACPFRFYLRHILGMEELEAEPRELDARAFGHLCHGALRALHEDTAVRRSTDERQIAGFLRNELRRIVRRDHGRELTVPLRVQLASAEKRLAAFAEWQANSVREGWETVQSEVTFEALLGKPWQLAGMEVRGRIDRVDVRGTERRIIDFKTSDSPKPVAEAHWGTKLSATKAAEVRHDWQKLNVGGVDLAWRDLQLPLYALAAQEAFGPVQEVGYFHLTKAAEDCGYDGWAGLEAAALASAQRCAEGVIEAVRAQAFWPPNPPGTFDDFARLFGGSEVEEAIDPSALIRLSPA